MTPPEGQAPAPFSRLVYAQIALRWRAWKNGIPPGREWKGLGAQNPHLLLAFAALDRAEDRAGAQARAKRDERPVSVRRETTEEFRARMATRV